MLFAWQLVQFGCWIHVLFIFPIKAGFFTFYHSRLFDSLDICVDVLLLVHALFVAPRIPPDDLSKASQRYFSSSDFLINLICALPVDTICEILLAIMEIEKNYELMLAALRTPRFLLIAKLVSFLNKSTTLRWSAFINPKLIRVFNTLLFIFLLVHWIGCGWFLLANVYGFGVDEFVPGIEWKQNAFASQYLYAAFWALCRITDSPSGTGAAQNDGERIFQMIVSVAGISTYATIVGNMGHLLMNMDQEQLLLRTKMEELNHFFRVHRIPHELQKKIRSWQEFKVYSMQQASGHDLISQLPEPIRGETAAHLNKIFLDSIGFFARCDDEFVNALCTNLEHVTVGFGIERMQVTLAIVKRGSVRTVKTGQIRTAQQIVLEPFETLTFCDFLELDNNRALLMQQQIGKEKFDHNLRILNVEHVVAMDPKQKRE